MLYIAEAHGLAARRITMKEHYKGLGHVAIYTADMEQSIAFYEKIGGSVYKRDGVQTPAKRSWRSWSSAASCWS